jgi:hypothetical protein
LEGIEGFDGIAGLGFAAIGGFGGGALPVRLRPVTIRTVREQVEGKRNSPSTEEGRLPAGEEETVLGVVEEPFSSPPAA